MTATLTDDRTARIDAFKGVKAIVDELRGVKLSESEADTIVWAAEGVLLAAGPDSEDAQSSRAAFETLMNDLEAERWADMLGTPEHPGTARRLRSAFAACAIAD